jgi:tRNA (adenine22-N1)-methyltransferase
MIELSKRLLTIAEQVPPKSRIADIGSDHGLLPVYLVQSGRATAAIAGELNEGPFEAAQKQVVVAGLQQQISVRRGDGLSVLQLSEADVITIAGMGGSLIADILEQGKQRLAGVQRLVLQPNVAEDAIRRWLVANDWLLIGESILLEDGKHYEVLTAIRTPDAKERNAELYAPRLWHGISISTDWLYVIGPMLVEQAGPVFVKKWQDECRKREKIIRQMEESQLESAALKRISFCKEIEFIKEMLACLPMDKSSFR